MPSFPSEKTTQQRRMQRWRLANSKHIKAYQKAWKAAHPEEQREHVRRAHEKHRDKYVARKRARYYELRANPQTRAQVLEQRKRDRVLTRYGLSNEQYHALLAAQAGGCAICAATMATRTRHRLYVDHDHKTGAVRGLLCRACNTGLGSFGDSAQLVVRAAEYLHRSQNTEVAA